MSSIYIFCYFSISFISFNPFSPPYFILVQSKDNICQCILVYEYDTKLTSTNNIITVIIIVLPPPVRMSVLQLGVFIILLDL